MSTRRFCEFDKDSVYTNALVNSVKYTVQGGKIVLYSATGKQTLVLTPYVAPPVINPAPPAP